ncbi:MAG: HD domain-containing protein [Desulfovibrionaceae bacterium]|nr:HD domain-containing protein [Desulfovibrionaceae bacterium]MBF0512942.1 HD domain-containing protein [Desulfovibrionaceae bacterium]
MSRKRILIVEDEGVVALDIKNRLGYLGYDAVASVRSGEEAVAAAGSLAPDLALMDIRLEGAMDGVDAALEIKRRFGIPVVYITGNADEATLKRAQVAGPFGYILKPFEDRELHITIQMALYKHSLESRLIERERLLSTTLESIGEAVLTVDAGGLVQYLNPVGERLLGVSMARALGRPLTEIFKVQEPCPPDCRVQTYAGNGPRPDCQIMLTGDGQRVFIEKSITPVQAESGHGSGSVLVVRDISARVRAEQALIESLDSLRLSLEATVEALGVASEKRDPYTAGHQRRTALLAQAIAVELGLDPHRIAGVRAAGLLHDIGKISIPAEILTKPAKLTEIEFGIIRTHPLVGYEILKTIPFPWPVADIVLSHHERLNGSGYPRGLSGDAISLEARIMAVADVVEAMSSHRPYRPALGTAKALGEVMGLAGTMFDPDAVKACARLITEKGFSFEAAPDAAGPDAHC